MKNRKTTGIALGLASVGLLAACSSVPVSAKAECCNFQVDNMTSFTVKLFADDDFKCAAKAVEKHPKNYCTTELPEGRNVTLTLRWPDGHTQTADVTVMPGQFRTWTVTN